MYSESSTGRPTILFLKIVYLVIHERHTERERERQRHRQREKQAPYEEPNAGFDSRTPGSSPGAEGRRSTTEPPRRPLLFLYNLSLQL